MFFLNGIIVLLEAHVGNYIAANLRESYNSYTRRNILPLICWFAAQTETCGLFRFPEE